MKFSLCNNQFIIDFDYFVIKTSSEFVTSVKEVYWDGNCIMLNTDEDLEILGVYSLLLSGDFDIDYRQPFELNKDSIGKLLNNIEGVIMV